MKPTPQKNHLRATYAALYSVAAAVPEAGVGLNVMAESLGHHLDRRTFDGLVSELERRKVLDLVPRGFEVVLMRGREYVDGLERLRLVAESFNREPR